MCIFLGDYRDGWSDIYQKYFEAKIWIEFRNKKLPYYTLFLHTRFYSTFQIYLIRSTSRKLKKLNFPSEKQNKTCNKTTSWIIILTSSVQVYPPMPPPFLIIHEQGDISIKGSTFLMFLIIRRPCCRLKGRVRKESH